MIGTIRKHSKWLWWVIAGLTVVSFLYWGAAPATRNGGGVIGSGGYGTLYGHKITAQEFEDARSEFYLFYWIRNNEWPDSNPNLKEKDLEEQIYLRMMLTKKAEALGIYATDKAAADAASEILLSLGRNGQTVSIQTFVQKVLTPKGLTADDFARFCHDDVVIQQLIRTLGLTGSLITPQEAAAVYQREHQEVSAQVVFFSASNYLSQVVVTPAAIAQFYTNYLAQYRLPDRVQVNYVEFSMSNYLSQAESELAKTNLNAMVDADYQYFGPDYFPDAKTPEAAKAKFREAEIHKRALADARAQANDFATAVFNVSPLLADNLATVAKQKGLTVRLTAPFDSYGPAEFHSSEAFVKAAFALTSDDPLAGPIVCPTDVPTAVYVIALAKQLPSEIPSLDQIRDRVTQDYRTVQATMIAQRAGTNFAPALASQLMAGHSFASACIAAGLQPETLPAFSLSTQELPELANRAGFPQVKQATFTTPAGRASGFEETEDGGFIVYVQSRLPLDQAAMTANLPQYTAALRRGRENEAFNEWLQTEANHQLSTTPVFLQNAAAGAK